MFQVSRLSTSTTAAKQPPAEADNTPPWMQELAERKLKRSGTTAT